MTRFLLTPTLHDAVRWYRILESKPKEELLATLRKEQKEQTEAMRDGIRFEDDVFAYTENRFSFTEEKHPYQDCVREVGDIVRGGLWQQRVEKKITVAGRDMLIYGKLDVIRRDWIYDIKFSQSYDIGKYTGSIQHLIYMFNTGIEKFRYLISDGRNVFHEDYFWGPDSYGQLVGEIDETVKFIMSDPDFRAAYLEHWVSPVKEAA